MPVARFRAPWANIRRERTHLQVLLSVAKLDGTFEKYGESQAVHRLHITMVITGSIRDQFTINNRNDGPTLGTHVIVGAYFAALSKVLNLFVGPLTSHHLWNGILSRVGTLVNITRVSLCVIHPKPTVHLETLCLMILPVRRSLPF